MGQATLKKQLISKIQNQFSCICFEKVHPAWQSNWNPLQYANEYTKHNLCSPGENLETLLSSIAIDGKEAIQRLVFNSLVIEQYSATATLDHSIEKFLGKAGIFLSLITLDVSIDILRNLQYHLHPFYLYYLASVLIADSEEWHKVDRCNVHDLVQIAYSCKPCAKLIATVNSAIGRLAKGAATLVSQSLPPADQYLLDTIFDNEEVVAYRGFLVSSNDRIRKVSSANDYLIPFEQNAGSGISFTLSKEIAHWFCWRKLFMRDGLNQNFFADYLRALEGTDRLADQRRGHSLTRYANGIWKRSIESGLKPVLATFRIRTCDIACINFQRDEQELVVLPEKAPLIRYRFLHPCEIEKSLLFVNHHIFKSA
jgi:hypothetical protein